MKVLLLSPLPPPSGGIATWTKRMLTSDLPKGWKVEHIDTKLIGKREVFNNTKLDIFTEIKRSFKIIKNLIIELKDRDIKIVHTNIPCSTPGMCREILNGIIVKLYKRKFIVHCRCTIPNMVSSKSSIIIFKMLLKLSDGMIVLNIKSKKFVDRYSKNKSYLIPNFVSSNLLNRSKKYKVRERVSRVIYVGGVIPSKGCNVIFEASKYLPDIKFVLVGKYPESIDIDNIPKNIELLGEQDLERVESELYKSDIFIFPSFFRGEGFSNALAEAMGKGLPCIVSDWAANKDMIENKGGIVIPIKDEKELYNAIKKLDSYELREKMSEWNINKVKKYYTDKQVLIQYTHVYESVMK